MKLNLPGTALPTRAGVDSPPGADHRPIQRKLRPWVLPAAAALLMAACGGGGGDDAGNDTDYAVKTAMGHWLTDTGSWVVSGKGPGGRGYTVNIATTPMAPGTVPIVGGTAARSLQTFTATIDGDTIGGGPTYYFDSASLSFVASDNGTGSCSVATANTALPSSARVGASGALFTTSDYNGCSAGAAAIATTMSSWSLESVAGFAMLCWKLKGLDLSGAEIATESACIEIAPDGTLGRKARLVVSASGVTLIDARNF